MMADEPRGPGETTYQVSDDDKRITKRRWNDPAWETHHVILAELRPRQVASLLRQAYLEGFEDRGVAVRNALGVRS